MMKKTDILNFSQYKIQNIRKIIDFDTVSIYPSITGKCPLVLRLSYKVEYHKVLDEFVDTMNSTKEVHIKDMIPIRDEISDIILWRFPNSNDRNICEFEFYFRYHLGEGELTADGCLVSKESMISRKNAIKIFEQIIHIIENIPESLKYFSEFYNFLESSCEKISSLNFLIDCFRDTFRQIVGVDYLLYLDGSSL